MARMRLAELGSEGTVVGLRSAAAIRRGIGEERLSGISEVGLQNSDFAPSLRTVRMTKLQSIASEVLGRLRAVAHLPGALKALDNDDKLSVGRSGIKLKAFIAVAPRRLESFGAHFGRSLNNDSTVECEVAQREGDEAG